MPLLTSVCVYCGSNVGAAPEYTRAAEEFGILLARNRIRLVYGGGAVGLMGVIARSVLDHGGAVTGVIPRFLKEREVMLEEADDLVVTEDMHQRKRIMFERSDAFVALPGGIGTLEETVEMLTWSQLGQNIKPVLLANIGGFWTPLIALFHHMEQTGFIRDRSEVHYHVVDKIAEIIPKLQIELEQVGAQRGASVATPAGGLA